MMIICTNTEMFQSEQGMKKLPLFRPCVAALLAPARCAREVAIWINEGGCHD